MGGEDTRRGKWEIAGPGAWAAAMVPGKRGSVGLATTRGRNSGGHCHPLDLRVQPPFPCPSNGANIPDLGHDMKSPQARSEILLILPFPWGEAGGCPWLGESRGTGEGQAYKSYYAGVPWGPGALGRACLTGSGLLACSGGRWGRAGPADRGQGAGSRMAARPS